MNFKKNNKIELKAKTLNTNIIFGVKFYFFIDFLNVPPKKMTVVNKKV